MPPKTLRTLDQWKNHLIRQREKQKDFKNHFLFARSAKERGINPTARIFGVSKDIVRYWKKKFDDPTFHPGTWGGSR